MYSRRGTKLSSIKKLFKLLTDKVDTALLMRRADRIIAKGKSPKR